MDTDDAPIVKNRFKKASEKTDKSNLKPSTKLRKDNDEVNDWKSGGRNKEDVDYSPMSRKDDSEGEEEVEEEEGDEEGNKDAELEDYLKISVSLYYLLV